MACGIARQFDFLEPFIKKADEDYYLLTKGKIHSFTIISPVTKNEKTKKSTRDLLIEEEITAILRKTGIRGLEIAREVFK